MRSSLDGYAAEHQHSSKSKLAKMKARFNNAIQRCEEVWGNTAFRRFDGNVIRDQFMSAVYDAQMVSVSELSDSQFSKIEQKKSVVVKEFLKLFDDVDFADAIRVSTNSPSKVLYRITKIKEIFAKHA